MTEIIVKEELTEVSPEILETTIELSPEELSINVEDKSPVILAANSSTEIQLEPQTLSLELTGSQGPAGPPGLSNIPDSFIKVIPSTLTLEVDSFTFATSIAAKWLLTIKDSTNDLVKYCEVSASSRVDGTTRHTVFSVHGDAIDTDILVDSDGTTVSLSVTNNTIEGIIVFGTRLTIFQ